MFGDNKKVKDLLDAIKPIIEAVNINDLDTLGRTAPDELVIWAGEGSWSRPKSITLGDLRKIKILAEAVK